VALAFSLSDLSNQDATAGLKAALEKGANTAVANLGRQNGFLNNDKVKIHLPSALEQAMPIIRMTGQGGQVDGLVTDMNHAAEAAVPLAKPLLVNAVKSMSVSDAKNILTGGDTGDRLLPPEDLG
jgi:ribosomal protein L21E